MKSHTVAVESSDYVVIEENGCCFFIRIGVEFIGCQNGDELVATMRGHEIFRGIIQAWSIIDEQDIHAATAEHAAERCEHFK